MLAHEQIMVSSAETFYKMHLNLFAYLTATDCTVNDCQSVSKSISQSVSKSISQSVSKSISQSVSKSISQPVSQSVSQSVSKSISQ